MAAPSVTNTFTNGNTADATQVNQNFTDLINGASDGTKDYSISALTVAGVLTANGNVTLGNASGDDITVTGSLAASVPIKTNNSFDIGAATLGLAGVYLGAPSSRTTRITANQSISASHTLVLPNGGGTSRYYMETNGSGALSWVKPARAPGDVVNYGLAAAVAANALTVTFKGADGNDLSSTNPVVAVFRNATAATGTPTEVEQTANLTLTVSSGSTLGFISGQTHYSYVYLINNAGTLVLGISAVYFDAGTLVSSTAEGGAGAADSNAVIYTTSAVTSKASIPICRMKHSLTTAGTWDEVPDEISLWPFFVQPVACRYNSNTLQAMDGASAANYPILEDRIFDTHGFYNASTGDATIPKAGKYGIMSILHFTNAAWNDGNSINFYLRKNGSGVATCAIMIQSSSTFPPMIFIFDTMDCAVGDVIDLVVDHNRSAGNTTLAGSSTYQFLSIWEIPAVVS